MPIELPGWVQAEILAIRSNNTSGAAALARRAAEVLVNLSGVEEYRSPERFSAVLIETGRALAGAQPLMAPVFNLVNNVLLEIERLREVGPMRERLRAVAADYGERLRSSGRNIAGAASNLIREGMTVMTHSYSDTVLEALLSAKRAGKQIEVICTESRPICEGTMLAAKLGLEGVHATLITDAAMLSCLPHAQLVLVGADAVTSAGLVNKTGTSMLALSARTWKKDVYALCGSEKFLPARYPRPEEAPKDPAEIMSEAVPNVSVRNLYFDVTPLAWLTGVVTEQGRMKPADVNQRLALMRVHSKLLRPALAHRKGHSGRSPVKIS